MMRSTSGAAAQIAKTARGTAEKGGSIVVLVKPQFEVEPKLAPKGVVRDPSVRQAVVRKVSDFLPAWGFSKRGECPSPIQGPEGNVEFFLHFVREDR